MAHQAHSGSTLDPTGARARERILGLHQAADSDRLAALSRGPRRSSLRLRLGTALIAVGSTLVTPVEARQPFLTD